MKVKLGSQIFSTSVANAPDFVKDQLSLPQFHDAAATIRFIRIFDTLCHVLNSRNMLHVDYKKPISLSNYDKVDNFLTEVNSTGSLKTNRVNGFPIFNTSSISIENPRIKYLPLYKISQDHIELSFSSIRAHEGYNNNPSTRREDCSKHQRGEARQFLKREC